MLNSTTRYNFLRSTVRELGLNKRVLSEANQHEPWGAYYRLRDEETEAFADEFFPEIEEMWCSVGSVLLRPTITVVLPGKQIPMHDHQRHAELVKAISGSAVVSTVSRCGYADTWASGEGRLMVLEQGVGHSMAAEREPLILAGLWGRMPHAASDEHDHILQN